MNDVVIIDALRTPIGRRNGSLSSIHAADLLGEVLRALVALSDIDPEAIGQVIAGCVQQVGMQSGNVARTAWLAAGLPLEVPATTVNVQCGSGQQAATLAHGLLAAGLVDVAVACGVENMSAVPFGSTIPRDPDSGPRYPTTYETHYEATTQFEGADRIAAAFGISRFDTEELGLRSQSAPRAPGRMDASTRRSSRSSSPTAAASIATSAFAASSLDALAGLRTNRDADDAVHTAGTSSQIADGASVLRCRPWTGPTRSGSLPERGSWTPSSSGATPS